MLITFNNVHLIVNKMIVVEKWQNNYIISLFAIRYWHDVNELAL